MSKKILILILSLLTAQSTEEIIAAVAKKAEEDRVFLESSENDNFDEYFELEDGWNDYAGLWIDSDNFLENDADYVANRERAHDKQLEEMGYEKDPRMPEQPNIGLYPDKNTRVEHYVKTPRLPPGFAYTIRHCVAQSEYGPIYKLIFNRCFDHKLDVKRHTPGVAFSESRITFRKFKFLGVPGGWEQKIRYACKISLCQTGMRGSCVANNDNCPEPPPELPATGINERKRFFADGYRGLSEAQMVEDQELKPFGGRIVPEKTTSGGITLKSTMAIKRSEKHGFNLHVGTHIFKKLNKTIDNNGTMETFETTEKVEPMTGREVKLGIARHLFKTGVKIKDLIRMELIKNIFELQDQADFVRMKRFHDHSIDRHKRKDESKKAFRKRVRNLIKSERASDPNYIAPKARRRLARQRLRETLKNDLILSEKNQIDYNENIQYEDEPEY